LQIKGAKEHAVPATVEKRTWEGYTKSGMRRNRPALAHVIKERKPGKKRELDWEKVGQGLATKKISKSSGREVVEAGEVLAFLSNSCNPPEVLEGQERQGSRARHNLGEVLIV